MAEPELSNIGSTPCPRHIWNARGLVKSFLHADGAYCRRYGCGESDDSIGTKNPAKIQRVLAGRYSDVERSDAGVQT